MSMLPIEPDLNRRCFSACLPGSFCRCLGEYIEQPAWDPEPEKPAPDCPPVDDRSLFQSLFGHRWTPEGPSPTDRRP